MGLTKKVKIFNVEMAGATKFRQDEIEKAVNACLKQYPDAEVYWMQNAAGSAYRINLYLTAIVTYRIDEQSTAGSTASG